MELFRHLMEAGCLICACGYFISSVRAKNMEKESNAVMWSVWFLVLALFYRV